MVSVSGRRGVAGVTGVIPLAHASPTNKQLPLTPNPLPVARAMGRGVLGFDAL